MLTIGEIKEKIAPFCREYGVERAYLFGSYARGDATEKSDVDIRIEEHSPKLRSLFQEGAFQSDLESALHKPVDMITFLPDDDLFSIFRNNVLDDEVLIYEAE